MGKATVDRRFSTAAFPTLDVLEGKMQNDDDALFAHK